MTTMTGHAHTVTRTRAHHARPALALRAWERADFLALRAHWAGPASLAAHERAALADLPRERVLRALAAAGGAGESECEDITDELLAELALPAEEWPVDLSGESARPVPDTRGEHDSTL